MRYAFCFTFLLLMTGGVVNAQERSEAWRREYENRLAPTPVRPVQGAVVNRDFNTIERQKPGEVLERSMQRPIDRPMDRAARFRGDDDFVSTWQEAPWPSAGAQQKSTDLPTSPQFRDRRNTYADSMYQDDNVNYDYRNPYRDYDDPDADGYGDSNRFNNDSDYLSPSELQYKPKIRPIFFGQERYNEVEQRWDDRTMYNRSGTGMTGMRSVLSPRLDMSRWR